MPRWIINLLEKEKEGRVSKERVSEELHENDRTRFDENSLVIEYSFRP